ncbi:MAG: hypothetical protein ACREFC_12125, partial [Stellaceae bacterium]
VQNLALAVAGLLALFGGVFPLLRWLRSRPMPSAVAADASRSLDMPHDFAGAAGSGFAVDVDVVRKIVANDPGRTAQVIKEWIGSGSAGSQRR